MAFAPVGAYVPAVRTGSLLYLSGRGPVRPDGSVVTGEVGGTVGLDARVEAAGLTPLQPAAAMRSELGSPDHVRRVVKTFGTVNCAPQLVVKVTESCCVGQRSGSWRSARSLEPHGWAQRIQLPGCA